MKPRDLTLNTLDDVKKELHNISVWYYKAYSQVKNFLRSVLAAKTNIKDIAERFELLTLADQRLADINYIISTLEGSLRSVTGSRAQLSNAVALKENVQKAYDKAWKVLNDIGSAGAPKPFIETADKSFDFLKTKFKGRYKKARNDFVSGVVKDEIHFVSYCIFENLKDDENYNYTQFIIMLTQVVDTKGRLGGMFVNTWTASGKPLPGAYRLGLDTSNDIADIEHSLDHLLSTERMMNVIKPHPIQHLQVNHADIKSSKVEEGKAIITFKKVDNLDKTVNDVLKSLKAQLGPRLYKTIVMKTRLDVKTRTLEVLFTAPHDSDRYISSSQWGIVQEVLNLTDEELARLIKNFI